MMMKLSVVLLSTLMCQMALAEVTQKKIPVYKSQRGDILEYTVQPNNQVSGFYTPAASIKSCPEAANVAQPIQGVIVGHAIAFVVSYPNCHYVLSTVANVSKDHLTLDALTVLDKNDAFFPTLGLGARYVINDTYTAVN
jgi:hypothetical protein